MSYTISFSDPAKANYPIIVADNTIYNGAYSGSLKLVGKNYPQYGPAIAENFVHLLENFASSTPPINPVEGQLWYDNVTQKLRINNGTANNVNWKPVNGVYQQATQPIDAVTGDIWVDTTVNLMKMYSSANQWLVVGANTGTNSGNLAGPIVTDILDTTGNSHQVVKFYITGDEVAVFADTSFTANVGFDNTNISQNVVAGLNLPSGTVVNGTADNANYLNQNGIKVLGSAFLRNDTSQVINGQFTIGLDGNALRIGSDPTLIIERTINGSNANFLNNYRSYGTFSFNIKDANFRTVPVLTVGGNPQQVFISPTTPSTSKSSGALVVQGGVGIGGDLYVGGNLSFSNTVGSTLTVATIVITSSTTSTFAGNVSVGSNLIVGNSLYLNNGAFYDSNNKLGNAGDILVSYGSTVKWTTLTLPNTTGNVVTQVLVSGPTTSTFTLTSVSTLTGAIVTYGGIGVGKDVWVGGNITGTNISSKVLAVANSGTFNTVIINGTTASTTTATGALIVKGGVGIGGDLYVNGKIVANELDIQYTTVTTTLVQTDDIIKTSNNTNAITTVTGAIVVSGGIGVGRSVMVGEQLYVKTGANTSPNPVAGLWPVSTQTYVLPTATGSTLGGVKIGSSLNISSGVIDINTSTLVANAVSATYVTTTATNTRLGGIVLGANLSVDQNAVVSVATATNSVLGLVSVDLNSGITLQQGRISLSTATIAYIGGVRIGENVFARQNGTLYIDTSTLFVAQAVSITTPASATVLGAVKIGSNVNVSTSGTISVNTGAGYVLPIASTTTLGGVTERAIQPTIRVIAGTGELRLNTRFNAGTGTAISAYWDSSAYAYQIYYSYAPNNTGYNVAYDTVATQDNLQARVTTSGVAQIKASTATMNVYWSAHQTIYGQNSMSPIVNNGAVLSTSTWSNIGTSNNLANGGDTIVAHVQDQDAGRVYRVTYIHTAGASSASAVIERII